MKMRHISFNLLKLLIKKWGMTIPSQKNGEILIQTIATDIAIDRESSELYKGSDKLHSEWVHRVGLFMAAVAHGLVVSQYSTKDKTIHVELVKHDLNKCADLIAYHLIRNIIENSYWGDSKNLYELLVNPEHAQENALKLGINLEGKEGNYFDLIDEVFAGMHVVPATANN